MLNLFDYDFGVRLIKPDPNIYYRTKKYALRENRRANFCQNGGCNQWLLILGA